MHTGGGSVIRSYRDLHVWQKGIELVAESYRLARQLPKDERFELSSQLRRAAVSVPANIAEGHGRGTRKDYAHFISIAKGSLAELETFIILTRNLDLAPHNQCDAVLSRAEEVGRMLTALRSKLAPKT